MRGDKRLPEHDLDQRRVGRELGRMPQRRDSFGRLSCFQERLSLEFVEIGVLWLCLDESLDLSERDARIGEAIGRDRPRVRSEEHTSELQSLTNLVCRLLLEKKK